MLFRSKSVPHGRQTITRTAAYYRIPAPHVLPPLGLRAAHRSVWTRANPSGMPEPPTVLPGLAGGVSREPIRLEADGKSKRRPSGPASALVRIGNKGWRCIVLRGTFVAVTTNGGVGRVWRAQCGSGPQRDSSRLGTQFRVAGTLLNRGESRLRSRLARPIHSGRGWPRRQGQGAHYAPTMRPPLVSDSLVGSSVPVQLIAHRHPEPFPTDGWRKT